MIGNPFKFDMQLVLARMKLEDQIAASKRNWDELLEEARLHAIRRVNRIGAPRT